jgi:hypothetical protein
MEKVAYGRCKKTLWNFGHNHSPPETIPALKRATLDLLENYGLSGGLESGKMGNSIRVGRLPDSV